MKKLLIAGLVVSLVMMFSLVAVADDGPGYDEPDWTLGEGIFENYEAFETLFTSSKAIGANYKTITNARVTGSIGDIKYVQEDQEGSVIINTLANIPCYLEMELIGNAGWTKLKSQGPGSTGVVDRTGENHWMFFDSKFGGFVGENWESIGTGAEFSDMGPNLGEREIYLQACDMWTANLWANINYALDVSATPLVNTADSSYAINMDMRHTLENDPGWTEALNLGSTTVGQWDALEGATVYMQFRVPYSAEVPAGAYEGDVTFRIYSI